MDLFQLEESWWAILKANKMHVKSVFSVLEVLRIWVHDRDAVVSDIGTNILVEPGISIFRLRRKELSYPQEGSSRFPQIDWVHLPNLMESQPITLFSTNWSPHTYHMPRFNIHEHQICWTALRIPQKISSKFFTSQNTWWCPPFEPAQHWEFIAVVCLGVTLTGGFGYK